MFFINFSKFAPPSPHTVLNSVPLYTIFINLIHRYLDFHSKLYIQSSILANLMMVCRAETC